MVLGKRWTIYLPDEQQSSYHHHLDIAEQLERARSTMTRRPNTSEFRAVKRLNGPSVDVRSNLLSIGIDMLIRFAGLHLYIASSSFSCAVCLPHNQTRMFGIRSSRRSI